VTARRAGEDLGVVRISDNGKGVPLDLRRKIFGRFFRMGEELERETPGLGLGLYIVRTMVRRLQGKIRVRDRDGGPGTTFEVTLPVARSGACTRGAGRATDAPPEVEVV
jgi:signal transduction histidine kinase